MAADCVFAVACLLLAPVQSAVAQPYDDTEARNLATVRAGFDAWRNGTGSPYDALADRDATWEIVGNSLASRVYPDKEDFVANVIRPFNTFMAAPLRPDPLGISSPTSYCGGFRRRPRPWPADGVAYRSTPTWFLTLRDNRIVKASAFFDSIAFNDLWQRVPA